MNADPEPPPFRADHVGSLLRPRRLTEAFKAHRAGRISEAELDAAQDRAIVDAVRLQESVGLRSITDGEFRRPSYWARFVERVAGLEVREALFAFQDEAGRKQAFTAPHVAAKLRRERAIAGDEYDFLAANTNAIPKITLPSPPTMHFWRLDQGIDRAAYESMEDCFADLARVYQEELADLGTRGARYVQLDEVPLAMLCDPRVRDRVRGAGLDPEILTARYIELCNRALDGRPDGMRVAIHLCRGNYKAKFLSEGGYEAVAETLFEALNVDAFFLEYDSPRAGDFAPLRFVPGDKTVVLGLISSKLPALETVAEVAGRIDDAARVLALEQLAVSPQCGFASTVAGNPLTEDDERAKLALVVEVARRVWG